MFLLQNADLIVFPEYGITGFPFNDRNSIVNFLEFIPDPESVIFPYNPCKDADDVTQPVQKYLSCLANESSLYIVANVGSYQRCENVDTDCPSNGQYHYNTNIILDDNGILVGRYRKTTLYKEHWFDKPKHPEYIYVDTPFGRIGTLVCFDVLFENPAIDLVEKYEVNTIAYTTAWVNSMPFLDSVDFHQSWAMRMGVNFLSSNVHHQVIPMQGRIQNLTGSGLYSGADGALKYYQSDTEASPKLLINEMPTIANKSSNTKITRHSSNTRPTNDCKTFNVLIKGDTYTVIELCDKQTTASLQVNNLTCRVDYSIQHQSSGEFYALVVFDGLHFSSQNYYIQVCAVVACDSDKMHCGYHHPVSHVSYMALTGRYDTKYVFPSVRLTHGRLASNNWTYHQDIQDKMFEITVTDMMTPIEYMVLYGRDYSRDGQTISNGVFPWELVCEIVAAGLIFVVIAVGLVVYCRRKRRIAKNCAVSVPADGNPNPIETFTQQDVHM